MAPACAAAKSGHLKVRDIDSRRMLLRVDQGKGGRDREVPLSPTLLAALREYYRWMRPQTYLFPGTQDGWRADRPITTKAIWEAVRLAARTRRDRQTRHAAHAEALVRDASAGGGRGPPHHPAAPRPRRPLAHDGVSPPVAAPLAGGSESARAAAGHPASRAAPVSAPAKTPTVVTRPAVEVADILHAQGESLRRAASVAQRAAAVACCARSRAVGPPPSAAMSITAARAAIAPSPITRVAIGTVRSVRRRRARGGSPPASRTCSTCRMCMSSSRYRMRCCRWRIGMPHGSTPGSSSRAQRRCSRSLRTRGIWGRRSASSAFCTRGDRRWSGTRTCTASCRPAASRRITSAGFVRSTTGFFLPVKVLSRVFRGKFVAALRRAYARDDLDLAGATEHLRDPTQWHTFVDALFETDWVVYAKPAFGGASAVLRYLGRYTHRVAISNHRLLAFDGDRVTFQWKDYAHGNRRRTMTLTAMEFLRRFVQHVLPRGFVRIRQLGYLANTCRTARLALAQRLLRPAAPPVAARPRPRRRHGRVLGAAQRWSSARSSPRSS